VSSNINIPVKRQIRAVRAMKEMMKKSSSKQVGQKNTYKGKKSEVQRAALASDHAYWEEDLRLPQTVLLVDGYNIIK